MECSTRLHSIGVPDDVPSTCTGLTWAYNVKSFLTVKTLLRNIRKTIRPRSHSTDAPPDQGLQCKVAIELNNWNHREVDTLVYLMQVACQWPHIQQLHP